MATTATNVTGLPTLMDIQKTLDPNGAPARIIELLAVNNPILEHAPMKPTNGTDSHLVTTRTGVPSPTWRKYNQGVKPVKGDTSQFVETCGMLNARIAIDKALAERNGGAAYRGQQVMAVMEGIKREVATGIFYHSTRTAPEKIDGFASRLDSLSNPYVIPHTSGASGNDQASIWLVGFGDGKVSLLYPQNSQAGIKHTPLVDDYEDDGAGGKFLAQRSHFEWKLGVAVEDRRYLVRIANIDLSALATTGKTLIDAMIDASELIHSLEDCRPVFFMPRKLRTFLRKQINDTAKNQLTLENVAGKVVMSFDGIPVMREDSLLTTEAPLS